MIYSAKDKSFNTERYTIGYNDGQANAIRDKHGLSGHGYDDRCPEGHSDEYCRGYRAAYSRVLQKHKLESTSTSQSRPFYYLSTNHNDGSGGKARS
jgi:hypothetical protein